MKPETAEAMQKQLCRKYKADYVPSDLHLKVGIAWNVKEKREPNAGKRFKLEGDTTGWFNVWFNPCMTACFFM